jgi:heme exporter protein C
MSLGGWRADGDWRVGAVLDGVAGIGMLVVLSVSLSWSPARAGTVGPQSVFHFHVATEWVGSLTLVVGLAAAVSYLWRAQARYDTLSQGSVEIGFGFVSASIVTGSVWTRWTQDTWWLWEPSLVTAVILWLIYLAYLMLRGEVDDPQRRARLAVVYVIPAFVSVPLTFVAFSWWGGVQPVMDGLRPRTLLPLWVFGVASALLYAALLRHRLRLASLSRQIASLREQLEDRGVEREGAR